MPDVHLLANLAAEKIRGGYKVPYAINSTLKDAGVPDEEKEQLRHEVAKELNVRSQLRKKSRKKKAEQTAQQLQEILREERRREAYGMAKQRGDHLLPDL